MVCCGGFLSEERFAWGLDAGFTGCCARIAYWWRVVVPGSYQAAKTPVQNSIFSLHSIRSSKKHVEKLFLLDMQLRVA
jgi:hypothetical protein